MWMSVCVGMCVLIKFAYRLLTPNRKFLGHINKSVYYYYDRPTSMSVSPQGMAGGSQEFAMQELESWGIGSVEWYGGISSCILRTSHRYNLWNET